MAEMPADSYKANIMIVDDTLPNLRVLGKMLTERGYLVRGITNGPMALTAAASEPPDLILLDIIMPEMDGYEVCKRLKSNRATRSVPVIFLSALDEALDKVRAFEVGGVDYITKPFQVEEVLARVATHLALQSLTRQLAQRVEDFRRANRALQESNDELDAFARTVAHDLKNPLASIVMGMEILQRFAKTSCADERTTKVVRDLSASARKMINIIDELLLLASVRQEEVVRGPVDMAEVVGQAQERLAWVIEEHHGEISLPASWPVAHGYAPWIEEVWANYLSNGLRYGGRPPRLELGATEQADGLIRFWVRDNGPGIPEDKLGTLFVEFARIERTRAEGHGLGLSVVKRIVTKLGGSVGVESTLGEGSTFYFTLPKSDL